MKRENKPARRPLPKKNRGRGLMALLPEGAVATTVLPEEVRAEIHRMSRNATEHLFKHMTYDEARQAMRHGWPSHYFGHLERIARKAKL